MVSLSKQIVISGYLLSFTVHGDLMRHFFLKRTHLTISFFFLSLFLFFHGSQNTHCYGTKLKLL